MDILSGLVLINGADIWEEYGVFLAEEKRGGMDNLTAIMTASKLKKETSVNIREADGEKNFEQLTPRNEPRDVTLCFALYAGTRSGWLRQYMSFIRFLKEGKDGWLDIRFPQLELTLHVRYVECSRFSALTYLWTEGVHAGRFKVKFREPVPIL